MREVVAMKPKTAMLNASGESPCCPRCGYDQTGATDWRMQCPLEGTCSECGLEFLWRDVLHPRFNVPKWCVEFGPNRAIPMRIVRTMLMMLRPWRFWSELKLHHQYRVGRIIVMLLIAIGVLWYAAFAVGAGLETYSAATYSASRGARSRAPWIEGVLAAVAPLWFSTNTSYGWMPRQSIHRFEPARIMSSGWHAVRFGINPIAWRNARHSIAEQGFVVISSTLLSGVAFALLPASRRIARVRWAHVGRIAAYSLMIVAVPIVVDVLDQFNVFPFNWEEALAHALTWVCAVALVTWWATATGCYLRIPHAWAVGVYVVVFAFVTQYFIFQVVDLAIELSR